MPRRESAPLAACGALLAVLALIALARPHAPPAAQAAGELVKDAAAASIGSGGRRQLLDGPLDINAASATDLELLPRIGPTLAERIVEERAHGGRFATVDELARVRGIGPRTLEQLRPHIAVTTENPPARLAP